MIGRAGEACVAHTFIWREGRLSRCLGRVGRMSTNHIGVSDIMPMAWWRLNGVFDQVFLHNSCRSSGASWARLIPAVPHC